MEEYQHILLAIDLSNDYQPVIQRALKLKTETTAISVLHCMDPLAYPEDCTAEIATQLADNAKQRLLAICADHNLTIPEDHIEISVGSAGSEIHRYALEHAIDLVVVGSHGKHGWQLLLGSTSNDVLRHANYDVLAVKLPS